MPRRLGVDFEGAIDRVMTRGNVRQDIGDDDEDRRRFVDDLDQAVTGSGWQLLCFVLMSNHGSLAPAAPR